MRFQQTRLVFKRVLSQLMRIEVWTRLHVNESRNERKASGTENAVYPEGYAAVGVECCDITT